MKLETIQVPLSGWINKGAYFQQIVPPTPFIMKEYMIDRKGMRMKGVKGRKTDQMPSACVQLSHHEYIHLYKKHKN